MFLKQLTARLDEDLALWNAIIKSSGALVN